ncbi:MAG TPA: DUF4097 family beta strand repeat-containing protein [Pyrinomonadaceae bacterium]|jgi:hypothetical protein
MKRTLSLAVVVAAVAAVAAFAQVFAAGPAAAPPPPQTQQKQGDEFRWREPLAAGRVIEVKGVNGGIEALPASGAEVEVIATKRSRRSNPDDVRVEVVRHANGVTICAVYPNVEGREPNTCAPGAGGRMNVQDNDTTVNFSVRVPAGVRFAGHTVNGKVAAENLAADVEARTVNGGVSVSTTGLARAATVNGSIRVVMGRADWSDELEFKTVNGGIDLSLPASLSAQVKAKTVNGDISTDFPLTVTGAFSRRRLNGTVGSGGRGLVLETVNGSVRLRSAS